MRNIDLLIYCMLLDLFIYLFIYFQLFLMSLGNVLGQISAHILKANKGYLDFVIVQIFSPKTKHASLKHFLGGKVNFKRF